MIGKKEKHSYVVALPLHLHPDKFDSLSDLAVSVATSPENAVKNILFKRSNPDLIDPARGSMVRKLEEEIRASYGNTEQFAHEVLSDIEIEGRLIYPNNPMYKQIQEASMASEISNHQDISPYDAIQEARRYLDFYNQEKQSQ